MLFLVVQIQQRLNYDSSANTDDGSCVPFIYGCMDLTAYNYDSSANTDDGSCIPFIFGCTDSIAINYNSEANTENNTSYYNPGLYRFNSMWNYSPLC